MARTTPESTRSTSEVGESNEKRGEILQVLDNSLDEVKRALNTMTDRNTHKKQFEWVVQAVQSAQRKTKDSADLQMNVNGNGGESQKEGIPVDELIDSLKYLRTKATGDDKDKFQLLVDKLTDNSKGYFELRPDMRGNRQNWRTTLEAGYISGDHRATGNADDDYQAAMDIMSSRRELVVPDPDVIVEPVETTTETSEPTTETPESVSTPESTTSTPRVEKKEAEKPEEQITEPTMEEIRPPSQKGVYIDITQIVERLAKTQAEEQLNVYLRGKSKEKTQPKKKKSFWEKIKGAGGAVKDFAGKVFVRMGEKQYLEKFYQEALSAIYKNKNLMSQIEARIWNSKEIDIQDVDVNRHFKVIDSVIETYVNELENDEEKGEVLNDPAVNSELSVIFYEYATGTLSSDRQAFDQVIRDRVAPLMGATGKEHTKQKMSDADDAKEVLYAHNFWQMAEGYKGYILEKIQQLEKEYGPENSEAIKNHLRGIMALDIQLGLKARDVRDTKPEKTLTWFDKQLDRLQNNRFLNKFATNPFAYGAGAGAVTTFVTRGALGLGTRAALSTAGDLLVSAAPAITGGLLGGLFSYFRKGREVQYDRGTEARRAALGYSAGGERATKMREFQVDMIGADDITAKLAILANNGGELSTTDKAYLADVCARMYIESTGDSDVDLISASRTEGSELGTKISSINQIKLALRSLAQAQGLASEKELIQSLDSQVTSRVQELMNEVAQVDSEFGKFRKEQQRRAACIGAITGMVGGTLAQAGILALKGEYAESLLGKAGKAVADWVVPTIDGTNDPTALVAESLVGLGVSHEISIPEIKGSIKLPDNLDIRVVDADTVQIVDTDGTIIADDIQIVNGKISAESLAELRDEGWKVAEPIISQKIDLGPPSVELAVPGFDNAHIKLPDGLNLAKDATSNTYYIFDVNTGERLASNLNFGTDGTLDAQSEDFLRTFGWNVAEHKGVLGSSGADAREYLRGKYGNLTDDFTKRAWHGNKDTYLEGTLDNTGTNLDNQDLKPHIVGGRGEHYPYEVPTPDGGHVHGTVFDWRELMMYFRTDKAGNSVLDASRAIKDMVKFGDSSPDGLVDDKFWAMKNWFKSNGSNMAELSKRFSFRFYLNEGDFAAGEAITVNVGSDGMLDLPAGSELEQILVKGGKLAHTIEMSYDDPVSKIHHIISTKTAPGGDVLIPTADTALTAPVTPGGAEYGFAPPDKGGFDWLIPTPFDPRNPLEKPLHEHWKYFLNSVSNVDLSKKEIFEQRRSKTLQENPDAKLDHHHEIEQYMKGWSREYSKEVKKLAEQMEGKMSTDVEIVACIPVAGHQEAANIYATLENYTYQNLDKNKFEIALYVNHPETDDDGNPVQQDGTLEEIERFRKDYPDMNVKVMYKPLPRDKAKIGRIRKMLNDAVLIRHHKRGKNAPDLVMVSNDADNLGVSPKYFEEFLRKYSEDPNVDGILGQLEWDPEAYVYYPEVEVGTQLFRYLDARHRIETGGIGSSGGNYSFKSSIYAGIGGYLEHLQGAEDISIGQAIVSARGNVDCQSYSPSSLIYTSARRAVGAWKKGLTPYQQWNPGFGAFDTVRTEELDRTNDIDYGDEEVLKKLKKNFQYIVNKTLDDMLRDSGRTKDHPVNKKVINVIGIRYELDDRGNVVITDMVPLIKRLRKKQKLALLKRDTKSGKSGAKEKLEAARIQFDNDERKRLEQISTRFKSEFKKTERREPLQINDVDNRFEISGLRSSTDTSTDGEYTIVQDSGVTMFTTESELAPAYKADGSVYIRKSTPETSLDKHGELPSGVSSSESYITDRISSSKYIALPVESRVEGGQHIRYYEAGATDLEEYLSKKGKLSPKESLDIISRVCAGIRELHEIGVVHTDVAASNVYITKDGAKIGDLDSCTILRGQFATRKNIRGQRFISPPELIGGRGEKKIVKFDKSVDVYELGIMLYELIAGKFPYNISSEERGGRLSKEKDTKRLKKYMRLHREGNMKFGSDFPSSIQKIIEKACSPYPESRYESIEQMGLDIIEARSNI